MTQTEHQNGHQQHDEYGELPDREQLLDNLSRLAPSPDHDQRRSEESAALDVQVATAKRYPRSLHKFMREARSMATIDQETAQSCIFALPRKGKTIAGPSIRLAEICASAWGHMHIAAKVIDIGESWITVSAVAWDMENNTRISQEVRRRCTDKYGKRYNDDMLVVTCAAASSIAIRNAIFRVIPRAYIDNIYRDARKVAVGDAKTLAATRAAMVDYFNKMGVTTDRILGAVEVAGVDDIGLEHVEILRGFATAIKEQQATVDECFPEIADAEKKKPLADKIKGAGKKEEPKPEPMSESQQAEIVLQSQRTGVVNEPLNALIKEVGAKKLGDLTSVQAAALIAKLQALPDAREPGAEG